MKVQSPPPTVCYQDEQLAVISKPAGLVVHPGNGVHDRTLLDWLAERWPDLADLERTGLLHRLDKDTSGLLIVAKTPEARTVLSQQFVDRSIGKSYLALVSGVPTEPSGTIAAPITRHHADRKKMAVRPDGKAAETSYRVKTAFNETALLEVTIATGRTHQIRVHLAALGHPVIGDATYGRAEPALGRHFLHAAEVRFRHPVSGRSVTVRDQLPPELVDYLAKVSDGAA